MLYSISGKLIIVLLREHFLQWATASHKASCVDRLINHWIMDIMPNIPATPVLVSQLVREPKPY